MKAIRGLKRVRENMNVATLTAWDVQRLRELLHRIDPGELSLDLGLDHNILKNELFDIAKRYDLRQHDGNLTPWIKRNEHQAQP